MCWNKIVRTLFFYSPYQSVQNTNKMFELLVFLLTLNFATSYWLDQNTQTILQWLYITILTYFPVPLLWRITRRWKGFIIFHSYRSQKTSLVKIVTHNNSHRNIQVHKLLSTQGQCFSGYYNFSNMDTYFHYN